MKKIILWKGTHSLTLHKILLNAWQKSDIILLLPPHYLDFSFLKHLPVNYTIEIAGDWNDADKSKLTTFPKNSYSGTYKEQPFIGVFSSGTTRGFRKLVLYSKENIKSSLKSITELFDMDSIKKIFCYPQPHHTFGLNLGYNLSILYNKEFIPLDGVYSSTYHKEWIKNHTHPMLTVGAPTHFLDLMNYCEKSKIKPSPSLYSIVGGARVNVELWHQKKEILGILLPSIGYGCTEASPGLTHLPPGEAPTLDGEIGYFLKNVNLLEKDENGFYFNGPHMCMAFIYNDELVFPEKIHVSDLIQKNESGSYIYCGRTDFILNRGGEKFQLEHIEHLLFSELKIEAVCGCIQDKRLGEELIIYYKKNKNTQINPLEISDLLFRKFGRKFNSKYFLETEKIPLNSNGKIDRSILI